MERIRSSWLSRRMRALRSGSPPARVTTVPVIRHWSFFGVGGFASCARPGAPQERSSRTRNAGRYRGMVELRPPRVYATRRIELETGLPGERSNRGQATNDALLRDALFERDDCAETSS